MTNEIEMVEITKDELDTLRRLRPHLKDIVFLMSEKVFEFKNGQIILHKDNDAVIRSIEFKYMAWRK